MKDEYKFDVSSFIYKFNSIVNISRSCPVFFLLYSQQKGVCISATVNRRAPMTSFPKFHSLFAIWTIVRLTSFLNTSPLAVRTWGKEIPFQPPCRPAPPHGPRDPCKELPSPPSLFKLIPGPFHYYSCGSQSRRRNLTLWQTWAETRSRFLRRLRPCLAPSLLYLKNELGQN